MNERRKKEMELAQRKEAAAKALLEREKKKAEQGRAEVEHLQTQIQALTKENEELRETNSALSRLVQEKANSTNNTAHVLFPAFSSLSLLLLLLDSLCVCL